MKQSQLLDILIDIGLTPNEASVYLASLSIGPSTVIAISRKAGTKRSTTYSVIETLKQKGLMHIEERGLKQLFVAEDPRQLDGVLEQRKESFHNALPEFSALYNLRGNESMMKYYEGIEGVKSVYESILRDIRPGDPYYIIAHQQGWYDWDQKWFEKFIQRRARFRIDTRLLFQDSEQAREHKKMEKQLNQKVKLFDRPISFTSDTIVCPQRLVIHNFNEPVTALVIENKDIIQTHIELFEYLWERISD